MTPWPAGGGGRDGLHHRYGGRIRLRGQVGEGVSAASHRHGARHHQGGHLGADAPGGGAARRGAPGCCRCAASRCGGRASPGSSRAGAGGRTGRRQPQHTAHMLQALLDNLGIQVQAALLKQEGRKQHGGVDGVQVDGVQHSLLDGLLTQLFLRVVDAAFDRPLRTVHNLRDLFDAAVVVPEQHGCDALLIGQLIDHLGQGGADLPVARDLLRGFLVALGIDIVKHGALLHGKLMGGIPLLAGFQSLVYRNAADPGAKCLRLLELVDGMEYGDEYVLGHVLGVILMI